MNLNPEQDEKCKVRSWICTKTPRFNENRNSQWPLRQFANCRGSAPGDCRQRWSNCICCNVVVVVVVVVVTRQQSSPNFAISLESTKWSLQSQPTWTLNYSNIKWLRCFNSEGKRFGTFPPYRCDALSFEQAFDLTNHRKRTLPAPHVMVTHSEGLHL